MKRIVFLMAIICGTYALARKPRKHRTVDVSVDSAAFSSLTIQKMKTGFSAMACFAANIPVKVECVSVDPSPILGWLNGDVAEKWKDANEQ